MPQTLIAHSEDLDPAAAFVNIAGTPDDHVTVRGDDIYVPDLNQVIALIGICDQTVASQMRLTSPSLLRRGFEYYLQPLASGLNAGSPPEIIDLSRNPLQLDVDEALQSQVLSNPGAATQHKLITLLADGPPQPITGQEIRTVRATAAITEVVNVWTNGALTFPVSLQAGRYAVVGCRVVSSNGVAFRLRFQGSPWRPGGVVANNEPDLDHPLFRKGMMGVWGEFDHRSPPTLDVLGVTSTAQEVFLDLIYLGA